MNTFIKKEFWSDPKVEDLDPKEKLSLIWLMTNPRRDLCGFTEISDKRFKFESGLEIGHLDRACEGLSMGFMKLDKGLYWVKNFISYQLGRGAKLTKNNITKSIVKELSSKPEYQSKVLLSEYPELIPLLEEYLKNTGLITQEKTVTHSPSKGLAKGKEKEKEREREKEIFYQHPVLTSLWRESLAKSRERSSKKKVETAWANIPKSERPSDNDVINALEAWKLSEKWDDGYAEGLHIWIEDRQWENLPEAKPAQRSDKEVSCL